METIDRAKTVDLRYPDARIVYKEGKANQTEVRNIAGFFFRFSNGMKRTALLGDAWGKTEVLFDKA